MSEILPYGTTSVSVAVDATRISVSAYAFTLDAIISQEHNNMNKLVALILSLSLAGCASKPTIETQVIEKPVAIPCEVKLPDECKDSYAVDRVSPADSPVIINRALRAEIEERWACEIKLRAAVKGCNQALK